MAYRYNGPRHHRYTDDSHTYDYDEQTYKNERQMYNDERQRYNNERQTYDDGHYQAKYHEDDTEYSYRRSRVTRRYDYEDERNRHTEDYSEGIQSIRFDSEISGRHRAHTVKYYDKVSQIDDVPYHNPQNIRRRVPNQEQVEERNYYGPQRQGRGDPRGHVREISGHCSEDGYGRGRGDTYRGDGQSKRETLNRSYHGSTTSSHGSSRYEEFGHASTHSRHRTKHGIDDQYESFTKKGSNYDDFRDTRHERTYNSATGRKSGPLIKDTPVCNNRTGIREARIKSHNAAKKREPLIKQEPLSDYSDYPVEMQHEPSLPAHRISKKVNSIGPLHISSRSKRDISSKPSRGLLATPDIESENETFNTEVDTVVFPKKNVIPIAEETVRDPVYHSAGLHPTSTVTADVNVGHFSTGLLPTPKNSPNENPGPQSTGLLPTPTCSPSDSLVNAATTPINRDVETIVYPSKGLLPTPTGSPTVAISSHPLMENDDSNSSLHGLAENQETFNESEILASMRMHEVENENIPIVESKPTAKPAYELSSGNTEKQMLENIQIQIELTKTLEGMQRTMHTLQQKIQTTQVIPSIKKAENGEKDKSDKTRELQKDAVIEISDDTDCVEVNDNVEETCDNTSNISSESDNQCIEKSAESPDSSGSQNEKINIEPEDKLNRNNSASCESQCNTNTEQLNNIDQQAKEISLKNSRNPKNNSAGPREYKTYREWRLAKERMNRYFNNQSSESEDNIKKKEASDKNDISQNTHQRGSLKNPDSNLYDKDSDTKNLSANKGKQIDYVDKSKYSDSIKEDILDSKRVLDNKCSPQEVGPDIRHSDRRDSDISNTNIGHIKPPDKSNPESIGERFGNKKEETRRERRDSNISNESFSEKKLKKKPEREKTEIFLESDRQKHKTEHISRHHSSDSMSSHHSRERSTHRHDRSKSRDHDSRRSHKHKSSHKEKSSKEHSRKNSDKHHVYEKSHKHYRHEKHSSGSKDKHNHHSSFRSDNGSSHKDSSDKLEKYESKDRRDKNEKNSFKDVGKVESSRQKEKVIEHKLDTEIKVNLFEKLAMESEIDVISGISSEEDKEMVKNDKPGYNVKDGSGSQKNEAAKKLKNVFVKLFDINKSMASDTSSAKKDTNKGRENIFEKMCGKIPSEQTVKMPSAVSKSKENLSSKSTKSDKTFNPTVPVSEESSSDVDPFVKMSMFLNKDKKKSVLTKTDPKVLNSSVSKKSNPLDKFLVSDDYVSVTDSSNTSESDSDETPQCSSYKTHRKKKEFVKYLKRLNHTLYWKNVILMLPRINLKRLNDSDIKRIKSKLKREDRPSNMKRNSIESFKTVVGGAEGQNLNDWPAKENRNKPKHLKVGASEIAGNEKINPENKESETGDSLHISSEKTGHYNGTADDREAESMSKDRMEESAENPQCRESNNEGMDKRKDRSTTAVERKQGNDEHSGKIYRRIIPVSVSSSAEQSESSDIERSVSVSQRDKQGPVIEDSDESEDLEGSLGSEDSTTCLDISDASEGEEMKQPSKKEVGNKESKADELTFGKQVQSEIKENADISVELPVFENVQNCEELVIHNNKVLVSCSKERGAQEPKTFPLKPDIQIKRNIFSDMTSDCSTQSETDTGTTCISRNTDPEPVKNILDSSTSTLSKVRANLGNTLKNLKVNNLQTHANEESSGPDFLCLPERIAILQRRGLNETIQSRNNISTDENADEVDGNENNDTVSKLSVKKNNSEVKGTGSEIANDGDNKLTCSESAGKNIRRRKYSDSSTDSSDDENFCQNRSSTKYRKKQLDKSTEGKSISQQNSKDDDKGMDKSTGPSDSVFGKNLPSRAKRLFKSSSQIKRSSSIMQMDGNADPISGPPDESSGEEGDVEDNLSCINIESEDEDSASQDLFADLPDRLKQMSQKFKQIVETSVSCDSIKIEKKDEMNENRPVVGSHNKDDSNSTTVTKENCLEENKAGNVDTEKTVVKEEPDWLKCYTQEPDTIFLSDDDDELIMSVSQPMILVSDEETQDPEADQKPVLDQVKQEKLEPDENYGTQDSTYELTFENYSSAEDWSDKGSDFEPENMFSSLHKKTTLKTDAVDSDQNLSDISLMSDDLFKSQSLLEPDNTSNEKGGFESSDGAVMSVNEDELLGSPNSDEAIMSINEDELLGIKSNVVTADHRSENLKFERKANVDKDFSTDDDEILSTSVFEIENKYKKTAAAKNKPATNVITKEDEMDSSQRLECVQKNIETVNVTERDQDGNLASTSSSYQEMTPLMQHTQVDPNISDENTSNSVTVFDFHSEHFSDISDSDSKSDKETKVVKNSPKPASNKNCDYETLSDDSDIMIIDNPKSEHEVQTQVKQFLHKKGNNSSRGNGNKKQIKSVYEEQTQVDDGTSEPDNKIQDQYITLTQTKSVTGTDSKTQIIKNKTDKSVMQDSYFVPTQVNKPEPSPDSVQTPREKSGSRQYTSQTQAQTIIPQLYGSQTQVDNPEYDVYYEQTQIDQPGPSNLSKDQNVAGADVENISYDSFSDEDPQLQSYFQHKTQDNTMKNMRLSQNLGIKFETFSDIDEEENNNIYERLTQVKQLAQKQNKQTYKSEKSKKTVAMKGKKTRTSIQDDDNIAYHMLTQAISSSDSQNAEDYGMLAQIDTPASDRPVAKSVPHPSVDNDAYLAATQIDIENIGEQENEHVDEGEDIYKMDTNNMIENDENRKKNNRIISEDDEKGLKNMQQQDSADDDAYLAATQAYIEDISEPENVVAETKGFYTLATQKDDDKMSNEKSDEPKKGLVKKDLDNYSASEDVTEEKYFYNMATQKDIYEMSDDERKNHGAKASDNDSTAKLDERSDYDAYFVATQLDTQDISEPEKDKAAEDEDFYNVATQKDIYEVSDSDEQIENQVEKGLANDTAAGHGDRRDNEYVDEYNVATQKDVDEMPDDDEAYFMETQADELPDIIQIDEDLYMGTTQEYVDTNTSLSKQVFLTADNKTDKVENKSISGAKSILKRPNAESTTGRNVTFGVQFESPVPKKARLSLSKRKILSTEPQKLKTTAEKRASGVSLTFKPHQFFRPETAANVNTDIEIHDATKSDMWLSKNIPSNKVLSKGTRMEKARKRKRKEDSGEALQAKMMAARSQLKERAMYNATHPEAKKRMKTGPTATVTSSELEDVTLPTGSQIIDQGLPLLNTTGILLKGHKSAHSGTEPELLPVKVTTATLSIATTTISTATSTSVPSTVQSTSVNITPRLHHSISNTGKNPKDTNSVKENDKHQGKPLPPGERSSIRDTKQDELSFQNVDKDHKDKKSESKSNKESSHSRAHGDKNSHRSEKERHDKAKVDRDKISKDKEYNRNRKNKEYSHSASKDSGNRERSGSGDSRKDREQKIKNKSTDKENDKQFLKTDESKKGVSNSSVDIRRDGEKHGKKREDRKHFSDKERHSSGQKEKHSGSKHSESRIKEKDSKHKSSENRQNISGSRGNKSAIASTESDVSGGIKLVSSSVCTGLSTAASTSLITNVTPPVSMRVASTSLFTPGVSSIATTSVTTGKTTQSVIKITTAVASETTAVSTSIAKPVPSVRPTVSTHIQSSILLQKQGSRPPTTAASSSSNLTPLPSTSGRQPFQPLAPNIPSNTELMPSNMVENTPNLQWNNFLRVILKWSPNWFEEREKMEQANRRAPPPDVTNDLCNQGNHMLYPLLGKYVSFKEYSEKFMLPLLLHETWESCFSTWREKRGKQKLSHHKLMFSHQAQGGDKLMVYTLIGLISEKDRRSGNYVNEGDLVKVTINGDMKIDDKNKKNLDYTMSGFIDKVIFRDFSVDRICAHYKDMGNIRKEMRDCISLKLNVRVRARLFTPSDQVVARLESVSTIINTWRQFTALSCIPRSPLCRDLLYPTANMTYCDKAPPIVPGLQDKYNESQLTAINTAAKIVSLPREVPRICLLQGPPGTGKSHTIVGIIKHIVRVTQGKCRMCFCAPSHAAVDELLRRLIKYNRTVDKNSVIKMVRLGKKSSVHQEIQSLCLDTLVQRNILQAQKDELLKQLPQSLQGERKSLENKISAVTRSIETTKDQFQRQKLKADLRKLEKQKDVLDSKFVLPKTNVDPQQERKARSNLLLRAHVVAGTLSRIGGNELRAAFQNISNPGFHVVIVDEATQAIELETLIPLQYGVTKVILVGDPEQLPPTVLSQVATENKFNMSLFERLDSHFKYGNINPVILLDTQYRMDPEIAAFPNKYVYNGKINNDRCVENRTQIPLVPYLLFNVSEGRELFSQGTRSMSNPLEAKFTAELCQFIVSNTIVIEKVIGIIAPYAKQKLEILKELEKRGLRNIEVSTVDGFQGREKHVIIMSCVRANESGTVGFVGNRNRMNVSLTRAKYAMYLVGHFESLESSDEWKALIADAKQRRKIVQMDQSSMRQAIKRIMKQQKRDFTSEN